MPSADVQERVMTTMSGELGERKITGNMAIGSDRICEQIEKQPWK